MEISKELAQLFEAHREEIAHYFNEDLTLGALLQRKGHYTLDVYDAQGNFVEHKETKNAVMKEGQIYFFLAGFGKATPITQFYLGLFSGNYTPVDTDTAATFPSAATEFVGYSETTRQPWVIPNTISTPSIDNTASKAVFTCTSVATIYGAMLVSNSVKNGTTGIQASAGRFGTPTTTTVGMQLVVGFGMASVSA